MKNKDDQRRNEHDCPGPVRPLSPALQGNPVRNGGNLSRAIPRWQGILFLVGVLLISTPDGVEIENLSASILMAIAFVPYGMQIIAK
jgi:hypothetical protein